MTSIDYEKKGTLFIVSAPSGAGKSTLIKKVMEKKSNLNFSVSFTTREPRTGEKNGIDYFFVSETIFLNMIKENKFLEYAKVFDKFYYGTSNQQVEEAISKGQDIIMDIDVQGATQIMKNCNFPFVSIFILPPSMKELQSRLVSRNRDNNKEIQKRLQVARNEIEYLNRFDYLVINDELEQSSVEFSAIINAEKLKVNKLKKIDKVIDIFKE